MSINRVRLVTAYKAAVDGKKTVVVIDSNRNKGGWIVQGKPSTLEVEFDAPVEHIDITFHVEEYKGTVSLHGLGLAYDNIMTTLPDMKEFTYRFEPDDKVKGKLIFKASPFSGMFQIKNISGFRIKEVLK